VRLRFGVLAIFIYNFFLGQCCHKKENLTQRIVNKKEAEPTLTRLEMEKYKPKTENQKSMLHLKMFTKCSIKIKYGIQFGIQNKNKHSNRI